MKSVTIFLLFVVMNSQLSLCQKDRADVPAEPGTRNCIDDSECNAGEVCMPAGFGKSKGKMKCYPGPPTTTYVD